MGILKHFPENVSRDTRKVYFSCHKDDFDRYFEKISAEITKDRNCAVFYDADYDGERDEKFRFDLSQMKLFVMPITKRLLTKPNRALGEELAFALEHEIPVLPLMQESGLEELYHQKFGDLQFLDKNQQDKTALRYGEKLDKYLSATLLDDETIKRIREEFDAQIFLSYRKKDRIHANRLMRLIHKNEFLRDVAIWYDEFLTPGENFNATIKEALNKSGLFVLAVTPNLVKGKNYVMTVEYPEAKKAGKIILPIELVKAKRLKFLWRYLLKRRYKGISDCVDSDDENALTEALLATAKKLVNDENDNSPEHNYLIGLAYLNGIDVEVDHVRAREMIEFAANADYFEAIDKMIEMYRGGLGAERNYETAIQWHEKKITLLQKRYNENPNEDNADLLFWALIDSGDEYKALGKLAEAKQKYTTAKDLCEAIDNTSNNTLRNRSVSYDRLGDIYLFEGNTEEAEKYYEKFLAIAEQLAEETNTAEAWRDLAIGYSDFGILYEVEGNITKAKKYYEKAHAIFEQLAEEIGIVEAWRDLAVSYNNLGDIYKADGDIAEAKEYYENSLAISDRLATQTGNVEVRYDVAYACYNLSLLCQGEERSEYLIKALNIMSTLCRKCPGVEKFKQFRALIQSEIFSVSETE